MHQDRMVGWCTLFLAVIGKDAPSYALEDDLDERERNHFWKTKKWAYANLNRLFVRSVVHFRSFGFTLTRHKIWSSSK